MTIALVANVGFASGGTATTSNIDTTGATLLVACMTKYAPRAQPTLSDSKGNTWVPLTQVNASIASARLFYCVNPTVGAGHNFTLTQGAEAFLGTLEVAAFSGVDPASPFDKEDGNVGSGAALTLDSVTPADDNSLVVTGICYADGGSGTHSINGGFTITDNFPWTADVSQSGALAYLVQGAAAAAAPQWSWSASAVDAVGVIAVFRAGAGGEPPAPAPTLRVVRGGMRW